MWLLATTTHFAARRSRPFHADLRPGTFFTCLALTSNRSPTAPSKAYQTGFQNTPVASITAWSTLSSANQAASSAS
jgi:hypothetical protein